MIGIERVAVGVGGHGIFGDTDAGDSADAALAEGTVRVLRDSAMFRMRAGRTPRAGEVRLPLQEVQRSGELSVRQRRAKGGDVTERIFVSFVAVVVAVLVFAVVAAWSDRKPQCADEPQIEDALDANDGHYFLILPEALVNRIGAIAVARGVNAVDLISAMIWIGVEELEAHEDAATACNGGVRLFDAG